MLAPATATAVQAAFVPSTLPMTRSATGASIGTTSIPAFRTTVGPPDHPAHTSADQAVPSANVARALRVRGLGPLRARNTAAENSATPVSDETTANPGDAVAYDVTFALRLPSAITAELVAITNPLAGEGPPRSGLLSPHPPTGRAPPTPVPPPPPPSPASR